MVSFCQKPAPHSARRFGFVLPKGRSTLRSSPWVRFANHTPFFKTGPPLPRESSAAQLSLARTGPLSSPRRRGPITTKVSVNRWPCHIALLRRMGPRLRGDDSEESLLHIFESGDPGRQTKRRANNSWVPAFART